MVRSSERATPLFFWPPRPRGNLSLSPWAAKKKWSTPGIVAFDGNQGRSNLDRAVSRSKRRVDRAPCADSRRIPVVFPSYSGRIPVEFPSSSRRISNGLYLGGRSGEPSRTGSAAGTARLAAPTSHASDPSVTVHQYNMLCRFLRSDFQAPRPRGRTHSAQSGGKPSGTNLLDRGRMGAYSTGDRHGAWRRETFPSIPATETGAWSGKK